MSNFKFVLEQLSSHLTFTKLVSPAFQFNLIDYQTNSLVIKLEVQVLDLIGLLRKKVRLKTVIKVKFKFIPLLLLYSLANLILILQKVPFFTLGWMNSPG